MKRRVARLVQYKKPTKETKTRSEDQNQKSTRKIRNQKKGKSEVSRRHWPALNKSGPDLFKGSTLRRPRCPELFPFSPAEATPRGAFSFPDAEGGFRRIEFAEIVACPARSFSCRRAPPNENPRNFRFRHVAYPPSPHRRFCVRSFANRVQPGGSRACPQKSVRQRDVPRAFPAPPKVKEHVDLALNLDHRAVKANVPKPAAIQGENGAFTIFSGNNRINIGVGRIMANGTQLTKIPAEIKNLTLSLSDAGVLTVSRDSAPPAEFKIPPLPAE